MFNVIHVLVIKNFHPRIQTCSNVTCISTQLTVDSSGGLLVLHGRLLPHVQCEVHACPALLQGHMWRPVLCQQLPEHLHAHATGSRSAVSVVSNVNMPDNVKAKLSSSMAMNSKVTELVIID